MLHFRYKATASYKLNMRYFLLVFIPPADIPGTETSKMCKTRSFSLGNSWVGEIDVCIQMCRMSSVI